MLFWPRSRPSSVLTFGFALLSLAWAQAAAVAQGKGNFKRVPIETVDGVELQGTFYPKVGGKKDACVLLLHGIDPKKGGNSHQDGWDHLAETLQKEGYDVLSFDFRGFGESKAVKPDKFWNSPNNRGLRGFKKPKRPESIDQKDFPSQYYPFLVNDIAAAKAFLDRRNDEREVNSSNLILIGAGEGATLGALWLAQEFRRQKATAYQFGRPLALDNPEGRDVACAVWLSISPTLAGRPMQVKEWVTEAARDNKVPTVFVYGTEDTRSKNSATSYLNSIRRGGTRKTDKVDFKFTGAKEISGTKLSGSQLLQRSLGTERWLIKDYLEPVTEKRGSREWKRREIDRFAYFWVFPPRTTIPAKVPGEELCHLIPLNRFMRFP